MNESEACSDSTGTEHALPAASASPVRSARTESDGANPLMHIRKLFRAGNLAHLAQIGPVAGDVLYLALEDNPRRLQRRLDRLMRGANAWPARLTLTPQWRHANEGGRREAAA
jgi:hypothetical protein